MNGALIPNKFSQFLLLCNCNIVNKQRSRQINDPMKEQIDNEQGKFKEAAAELKPTSKYFCQKFKFEQTIAGCSEQNVM